MSKRVFICCIYISLILNLIGGKMVYALAMNNKSDKQNIEIAYRSLYSMYSDRDNKIPKLDITKKKIQELIGKTKRIDNVDVRAILFKEISSINNFNVIKDKLYSYFEEDNLKLSTTKEKLDEIKVKIETLPQNQRQLLLNKLNIGYSQYDNIIAMDEQIKSLFSDFGQGIVRDNVEKIEIETIYNNAKKLPQKDYVDTRQQYFDKVNNHITEVEKKKQIELARQAAIEKARRDAIRREQEDARIQAAYIELKGVPYINQKDNGVMNGCEAASLLMGLQYRGIAMNHNLHTFADIMPKSVSNPHEGFVNSIYDLEPTNVTHWIAPDALARFGSTFGNVQDISGSSADTIREYINQGSPVIVYATYGYATPKKWNNGVPLNLHVMLVVGYNSITGAMVIHDPWAGKIIISKDKFEKIYNYLHYAVVIK